MYHVRSNYFAVRDTQAFLDFCARNDLDVIQSRDSPGLFGFLLEQDAQPYLLAGDSAEVMPIDEELESVNFLAELPNHLADDNVAIVIAIGNDKMRFLLGHAWTMNNKREVRQVNLDDIYTLSETLGSSLVTRAEY